MKSKDTRVVIIDSHPLLIENYRYALNEIELSRNEWDFKIEEANCGISAKDLFYRLEGKYQRVDLVFLDIELFTEERGTQMCGEDIGIEIRRRFPNAKIIAHSNCNNNYRIHNIFRSVNPDGFLIKTDVDFGILKPAILQVLIHPPFYSKSVLRCLQKSISHDILLDKWDRKLLYELSQGVKMKELPSILPFSMAAIEKRKRHIKLLFGIEDREDRQLLIKAREYGFI